MSPGVSWGAGRPDAWVARLQRDRILDAVVDVVAERGVAGASVELVLAQARVSRRAFYGCFAGLDECLVAIMDDALAQVAVLASRAFERERSWLDGMRAALAAVLDFFDGEPGLARVCLVETLGAGHVVREQRERVVGAFRELVVEQIDGDVSHASPLAAEGVLASVMGVVRARLIARDPQPLIALLGPLMGIIVGPFAVMDDAEMAREIELGERIAHEILAKRAPSSRSLGSDGERGETSVVPAPGVPIPDALLAPRAYRLRLCLLYVAKQGERGLSPSNREVGEGIGVPHRGQVTKLLGRLVALGLLVKYSGRPGRPNAWSATRVGREVASLLADGDGRPHDRSDRFASLK